jgi:hypothetical protein
MQYQYLQWHTKKRHIRHPLSKIDSVQQKSKLELDCEDPVCKVTLRAGPGETDMPSTGGEALLIVVKVEAAIVSGYFAAVW